MPLLRKGWTWSLSRCMALGASWKTSSQRTLQHFLTDWQLGWTGFRRATSLPSGGCGNGALDDPAFFMPEERSVRSDAGRFLRLLLGAMESEVDYIPPICAVCNMPRYSECPGCGTHWCDGCRDFLPFVPCAVKAPTKMPSFEASRRFAAYEGRGTACCIHKCYEDLGEICTVGNPSGTGVTCSALQPPQQGQDAIHPPCPQQVRFGSRVKGAQSGLVVHGDEEASLWPLQYWLQAVGATVLAMASGPGRYAAEVAAGPIDAATNLDQVQQARAREFRDSRKLADDADFAFYFNTYEEAKLAGGDFQQPWNHAPGRRLCRSEGLHPKPTCPCRSDRLCG